MSSLAIRVNVINVAIVSYVVYMLCVAQFVQALAFVDMFLVRERWQMPPGNSDNTQTLSLSLSASMATLTRPVNASANLALWTVNTRRLNDIYGPLHVYT